MSTSQVILQRTSLTLKTFWHHQNHHLIKNRHNRIHHHDFKTRDPNRTTNRTDFHPTPQKPLLGIVHLSPGAHTLLTNQTHKYRDFPHSKHPNLQKNLHSNPNHRYDYRRVNSVNRWSHQQRPKQRKEDRYNY